MAEFPIVNDLVKNLNNIKYTVDENDQIVWACEANTNCLAEFSTKLKDENERLEKDIAKIDKEVKEIEPKIASLKSICETIEESSRLGYETIVQLRLHNSYLGEKIENQKKECEKIIAGYKEHYDTVKNRLEKNTPNYKILKEKQTELRQIKINCMELEKQIKDRKEKNELKKSTKQRLFYNQIINYARSWLENKKYEEVVKKFETVSAKEKELTEKYLDLSKKVKEEEAMAASRREPFTVHNFEKIMKNHANELDTSDKDVDNPGTSIEPAKNSVANVSTADFVKPQEPNNPFFTLQALFEKTKNDFSKPEEINSNASVKLQFNPAHSKVKILQDIPLKPRYSLQPHKSKEERNKINENKLQNAMKNFQQKLKFKSQKSKMLDKSLNDSQPLYCPPESPTKLTSVPDASEAVQELDNINLLSQENPQFLSQESQILSQASRLSQSVQNTQARSQPYGLCEQSKQMPYEFQQQIKGSLNHEIHQVPQAINQRPQFGQQAMQQDQTASPVPMSIHQDPQKSQIFSNYFNRPQIMEQSSQKTQLLNHTRPSNNLVIHPQISNIGQSQKSQLLNHPGHQNTLTPNALSQTTPLSQQSQMKMMESFQQPQMSSQSSQQQIKTPINLPQSYQMQTIQQTNEASSQFLGFNQPFQKHENNFNSTVKEKLPDMKFMAQTTKNANNPYQFLESKQVNNANSDVLASNTVLGLNIQGDVNMEYDGNQSKEFVVSSGQNINYGETAYGNITDYSYQDPNNDYEHLAMSPPASDNSFAIPMGNKPFSFGNTGSIFPFGSHSTQPNPTGFAFK